VDLHELWQSNLRVDERPVSGSTLWGNGPAMQSLRRLIGSIAPTNMPVLITGETGTGKHMLALYIHQMSDYRDEPLVAVNCRSLVQGNMSHLLHSANGASHGTLLLDHVCELDPAGQRRLLELLPDEGIPGEGQRLQGRLIAISHRRLEDDLRAGKFMEALYFRLNDVCLRVPSLRQRKEDIPDLVSFFLAKYSDLFKREVPKLGDEVLSQLVEYSWPGNIRQLENAVKEVVALGDANSALETLVGVAQETPRNTAASLSFKAAAREASRRVERELLERALTKNRWNRKRAAQELQISYKSLLYKLKQMDLDS
jgi:two-component system, NtrC family, response regulator AtoC